jgi:hypothetical protein
MIDKLIITWKKFPSFKLSTTRALAKLRYASRRYGAHGLWARIFRIEELLGRKKYRGEGRPDSASLKKKHVFSGKNVVDEKYESF